MDQRGVRIKESVLRAKRCYTAKNAVLACWQLAQHDGQCGFVKILYVVRCNTDAHSTCPIGHCGQLCTEVLQNGLGLVCVMVCDVDNGQCGLLGIVV